MADDNAAAYGAAASVIDTGVNAYVQSDISKKTRKWNEQQYEKQKADNLAYWHMQNEYNNPTSQMQRLRDANLNPNMVYGQSSGGASGQAGDIKAPNPLSWNPKAPTFDLTKGIQTYADVKTKQAQTDALKTQATTNATQAALNAQTTLNKAQENKTSTFDLLQKERLADTSASAAQASLDAQLKGTELTQTNIDITKNRDAREALMNSQNVQESAQRILSSQLLNSKTQLEKQEVQQRINGLQKDNTLKQLDINLRQNGINPTDPTYIRVLGQYLSGEKSAELKKYLGEKGANIMNWMIGRPNNNPKYYYDGK
nr:MAG: DNA pilot protein [Microvirus sp.]